MREAEVLVIETTVERHEPEGFTDGETEAQPWAFLVATDAWIIGQHPFLEAAHQLKLSPGERRTLWHDGDEWRISTAWGSRYANRVLRWPAIGGLDTHGQYVLLAPLEYGEPMTVASSTEELR